MVKANNLSTLKSGVYFQGLTDKSCINEKGLAIFLEFKNDDKHKDGDIFLQALPPKVLKMTFYNSEKYEVITPEPVKIGEDSGLPLYIDICTRKVAHRRIVEYTLYTQLAQ